MGKMLLGFAAGIAVLSAAPATAQNFNGNSGGFVVVGGGNGFDQRGHHRRGNGEIGTWINGGEWALYNNRTWEADSYNDWWHDRPERAYPAWMRRNQDCARQWYSGDTLTC